MIGEEQGRGAGLSFYLERFPSPGIFHFNGSAGAVLTFQHFRNEEYWCAVNLAVERMLFRMKSFENGMKLEHIVALAVRLFAILVGLYAVQTGLVWTSWFMDQGQEAISFLFAGGMVFTVVVAAVLWRFPMTIARRLVDFRDPGESEVSSASAEQLQVVGFSILGLYLLFHVVSDLVSWAVIWYANQRNHTLTELTLEQMASMIATVVELVFVLFLLLGTRRITVLLRRLRYGRDFR